MSDQALLARKEMVDRQLKPRGIHHPKVIQAFLQVPREKFVPDALKPYAYQDSPLPIGEGQTISQPYIVALMTQAVNVQPDERILEIGTGSGYQAAILAQLCQEVFTIERLETLANQAKKHFEELEYENINLMVGDGSLGWKEKGPYDVILVTAGAPIVPPALIEQLKPNGRLILPVGDEITQQLLLIRKDSAGKLTQEIVELVRFVPLIGRQGWHEKLDA